MGAYWKTERRKGMLKGYEKCEEKFSLKWEILRHLRCSSDKHSTAVSNFQRERMIKKEKRGCRDKRVIAL